MDRATLVKQALRRLNSQKEHVVWQLGNDKEYLSGNSFSVQLKKAEVETRIANLEETLAIIDLTHELLTAEQDKLGRLVECMSCGQFTADIHDHICPPMEK